MSHFTKIQTSAQQQAAAAPEFASILIVDDQRFDRKRLKNMCQSFSFNTHVAEADSLAEMRDKLKKDRFDLVLLDYHLADGTGIEGVDCIRADSVNSTAAVVMITGTEQKDVAIQALKSGFSDYLTKDELSEESLARTAITALQKSQLSRGMQISTSQRNTMHASLQSFSRECAQDIKPIVSRMMRQMRELREIENISPQDATSRIQRVEGSLRRLWAFLDDLDQLAAQGGPTGPSVSGQRGSSATSINMRVPSERPLKSPTKAKPPSIFRRRPD
ncbi:response regulator [uncultured Sulfitobacter sp.]|uniref:response regulator n=1 Tax=uncultured Sulfitobacter sp. TaxID=191468 RepID=UPI002631D442|nr:response regulator [uncultured Sulfitobacter sp.]